MPQPRTDPNGILLTVLCAVAKAMHHNGRALHTTKRLLDKAADWAHGLLHGLVRRASCWLRVLWTLPRLLLRQGQRLQLVSRWPPLLAPSNPPMPGAQPLQLWWELWFHALVRLLRAPTGPTAHNDPRAWEGHPRVLQRLRFFCPLSYARWFASSGDRR